MLDILSQILAASEASYRQSRFPSPPSSTYIVWTDDKTTDGPDLAFPSFTVEHNITLEVYEPNMDDATEQKIETALTAAAIAYEKQDRYWLEDIQRYQTTYDFTIYRKKE